MSSEQIYQQALDERRQQNRFRQLRSLAITGGAEVVDDRNRTLINFASNDYLGLSKHPKLKERAIEFIQKYGLGAGSSRLVSGNLSVYEALERKIAQFKGTETALILPSGYQTNATVIAALGRKETLMLSDHQNHNSINFGMQHSQGRWQRYRHNDLTHLEARLTRSREVKQPEVLHLMAEKQSETVKSMERQSETVESIWILSESVFSMDGDVTDMSTLSRLATKFGAATYIDEAHATGVFGPQGRGCCYSAGSVDMVMGTFSKGMGSFGAYVACSNIMRDYLINFCSGLIYSTALPPAVLGSIDAALEIVPSLESEREKLHSLSEYLRTSLQRLGFSTGKSSSQIVPIIIGEDADALALAEHLNNHGMLAPAIRPPTVPEGEARVRLSLTADHTREQVDKLVACVARFSSKQNVPVSVGAAHHG